MTIELTMLAWAALLGLVHLLATGQFTNLQYGVKYGLGPRNERKTLTGVGGRVERAFANYMQNFPFFAAAVLIAHVAGRHSWLTVWGAHLFFWARLFYVPLYAAGVPVVRSAAFGVAFVGILMILVALT